MDCRTTFALVAAFLTSEACFAQKPAVKKSENVVKLKAKADKPAADGTQTVTVTVTVEKPYHLYANPVGNPDLKNAEITLTLVATDKPKTLKTEYPKSKNVPDAAVGDYKILEGEFTIKATVQRTPGASGPITAELKLQACTDKACLPPGVVKAPVEG